VLLQQQDAFFRASVTKDGVFMGNILHDEFVFISPRAAVMNKRSFTVDFVENPAIQLEVFETVETASSVVGSTAVVSGIARARFKDKDPFTVRTSMCFVFAEKGWRILSFQETFIP